MCVGFMTGCRVGGGTGAAVTVGGSFTGFIGLNAGDLVGLTDGVPPTIGPLFPAVYPGGYNNITGLHPVPIYTV